MLLAYVDESYCQECYFVTALVCPDDHALPLSAALDEVVARAAIEHGVPASAELHGYDIFQAKRDWDGMAKKVRARIGVYGQALAAIAGHDVRVVIRGVRSRELRDRDGAPAVHPHAIALRHLLERVDEEAERHDTLALVIADEPGQSDQQPEYRADLRRYRERGTLGYRPRRLTRIVDTLHFAPSAESRLLQAADLIAFLHHRIATQKPEGDARAARANAALWLRIEPRVAHVHCCRPRPRTHKSPARGGAQGSQE